ncbi:hypothetical protein DVH05_024974 [Phytophthora capsici]|nr:hypothetical protein DVH05_024974 [Phytophthora capsici]
MVELFCAIVGTTESAFSVRVNESDSVYDLKEAIKGKNDDMKCPARKLQLFLAKTTDDAWLKSKDHLRMRKGEIPNEVESRYMNEELEDPTDRISTKFPIEIPDGSIHVLVVSPPPDENTSPGYAVVASVLFQHIFLNVPSTTPSRTQNLKKLLVKKYRCDCGKNKNGDATLLCMVLNVALPISVVMASHIFRREHDHLKGHFVQIADIDDVRNGLLLFKPIESAFDDLDISFLVDKHDRFTLKVFNSTIKTDLLVDWLTKQQWKDLGGESLPTHWRTSKSPIYAPNAPQFNVLTTFGELDGKTLRFPRGSTLRPFRRCLYYQAQLARTRAITQGWVPDKYNFDDFSSEGYTLDEKMKLLFSTEVLQRGEESPRRSEASDFEFDDSDLPGF